MFSRHTAHKHMSWITNQLRGMCALTNLTGVLSEHKRIQYHELHCTDLHFLDFGLRSLFMSLMYFSSFFYSDNTLVDIVADEMLSHISTERDYSGSVGRFSRSVTQSKRLHHCNIGSRYTRCLAPRCCCC